MIFFTFLFQAISLSVTQIDKTIYITEGEEYRVNLDSIFNEINENTYSFVSQNKGFTLDTSNLKLKSDQGTYSQQPTKILRERQLVSLADYQGTGQFGILDEYVSGHRICYNSDAIINFDQCIELDNTATSYDFVFIAKDTIAVSKVRVNDQQFGVTIYQNKEIVSEFYFVPSKTYAQVTQTILEYTRFGTKNYLVFGVTELDSNIEFLEIQATYQIVNTNKVIDKSLLPVETTLQVYDIKGASNKVYVVCQSNNQAKLVISLIFENTWSSQQDYLYSYTYRGTELGYSFIYSSTTESYLEVEQDYFNIRSKSGGAIFNNLFKKIQINAQVRYTLNYFIVLQDNLIIVSNFQKLAQRSNVVPGTILKIDVDFQNDVLIVFTDTKIFTYYLKQSTLSFQSNTVTKELDRVQIRAVAVENEQIANIIFQVLAKEDYNLYLLNHLTQDLYCNRVFYSPKNNIPINGISGADVKVDGQVDDQVQIIPHYLNEYGITTYGPNDKVIIVEQLISNSYNPFLFRQFDDFSFSIYDCRQNAGAYQCSSPVFTKVDQKQKVSVQYHQIGTSTSQYALLNEDGLNIYIYVGSELKSVLLPFPDQQFVNFKVGTDRIFAYTINYQITFYYFPSGLFIDKLDLSQYGEPKGEILRDLWVNCYQSNLLVVAYGEDLIIGRFTSQFIFIQRITIKWVLDVAIIADNKFIVLSTDKTIKKLTLYILEDGAFRVLRELDTHGYVITGDKIITDYVYQEISIQGQKDKQKAQLVFGDTELARNSLLKVIKLEDDEYAVNIQYNYQVSSLLKRSTDVKKNSTILDLSHRQQEVITDLIKIPNKFSQSLDLKYIFTSSLSQSKLESVKKLYLEYQFYNLTANQDPNNKISYKNKDNQVKIPIKSDTFQGQVRTIQLTQTDTHLKLTTRFKNSQPFTSIPEQSKCKQVVSFGRLICIKGTDITYYELNGNTLSQISAKSLTTTDLKQLILRNDELYALVQSTGQLMLIYISQNEIKLSQAFYQWENPLDISIFYKGWLVVYYSTYLGYYQFQPTENNLWKLDKINEYFIYGIKAIQYDPTTQQIFYSNGYQFLYYFKSSLEGTTQNKEDDQFINLATYLQSQQIYQLQTRIENIKIITQYEKQYLFLSTSYGNILNMTIKSPTQEFQINSMYIVNGPSSSVQDIQIIDDYLLVQNSGVQFLFKNTQDWQLDKPYLTLEEIAASNFMGLYKNGSKIIHIYGDNQGQSLYKAKIDDEIFLTISDLKSYTPGNIGVRAQNGYGQADIKFQTLQLSDDESSSTWIWVIVGIVAVIAIAGGGFYWFKKRREQVDPLLG